MHFEVYFQTRIKFKEKVFCLSPLKCIKPESAIFGYFFSAQNIVHSSKHLNIYMNDVTHNYNNIL